MRRDIFMSYMIRYLPQSNFHGELVAYVRLKARPRENTLPKMASGNVHRNASMSCHYGYALFTERYFQQGG